ncbi:MAG: hypothetical protein V4593_08290 [Pseudomonadota bacterium]
MIGDALDTALRLDELGRAVGDSLQLVLERDVRINGLDDLANAERAERERCDVAERIEAADQLLDVLLGVLNRLLINDRSKLDQNFAERRIDTLPVLCFRGRPLSLLRRFEGVDHTVRLVELVEGPVLGDLVVGLARHLAGHHTPDGPFDVVW